MLSTIGDGASAKVVSALDHQTGKHVAIKVFKKLRFLVDGIPVVPAAETGQRTSDIASEIRLLKTAKETGSPFLISMIDACQDSQNCYLVMVSTLRFFLWHYTQELSSIQPLHPQSLADRLYELVERDEPLSLPEIQLYAAEIVRTS
jgi:serine/threonine protein kinase